MGRLADDYYLIAHDDRTGRLRVSAPAAGLGAAGAVVGELILSGHLAVREGGLFPAVAGYPPADRLLREVLAQIDAPRQDRQLGTWLQFLAVEAIVDLRYRLISDGLIATVRERTWFRRYRTLHLPTNPSAAAWPAIRLAKILSTGEALTLQDMVLTSLVQVTGLLELVLWLKPDHAPGWSRAEQARTELPAALSALVAHAEAAVGDGVLTRRGI
jgi:Golgi phosphoprotein 3 (GPP34)